MLHMRGCDAAGYTQAFLHRDCNWADDALFQGTNSPKELMRESHQRFETRVGCDFARRTTRLGGSPFALVTRAIHEDPLVLFACAIRLARHFGSRSGSCFLGISTVERNRLRESPAVAKFGGTVVRTGCEVLARGFRVELKARCALADCAGDVRCDRADKRKRLQATAHSSLWLKFRARTDRHRQVHR